MYTPSHFALDDPALLFRLMAQHPFVTLVVHGADALEIGHVPVQVEPDSGAWGCLRFHLAAANPLVQALRRPHAAVAVFNAPHAYISPHWYVSRERVPTWNYVVVHAHGLARELDQPGLTKLLDTLSADSEAGLDKPPWSRQALDPEQFQRLCRGIVGFQMPIQRLQGKAKLDQNKTREDREAAAAALAGDPHPDRQRLARWMRGGIQ